MRQQYKGIYAHLYNLSLCDINLCTQFLAGMRGGQGYQNNFYFHYNCLQVGKCKLRSFRFQISLSPTFLNYSYSRHLDQVGKFKTSQQANCSKYILRMSARPDLVPNSKFLAEQKSPILAISQIELAGIQDRIRQVIF